MDTQYLTYIDCHAPKKNKGATTYFALLFVIFFSAGVFAQKTGNITGNVITADGQPAQNISVALEGTTIGTATDTHGRFAFRAPEGSYKMTVFSIVCHKVEIPITVKSGEENHFPDIKIIETEQQLQEVVVTGQFTPQSLRNSLYKVKVIDRNQIEAKGATNVQTILNTELGIRLSNDMALGETDFEMLGMSGNNVKVLLDGVPLIDRLTKKQSLSQIDVNSIERIEVVEGPMSVIYGTDALAGVINIISRKQSKKRLRLGARLQEETIGNEYQPFTGKGVHNRNINVGYRLGNGIFADATFTQNLFGGWKGSQTGRATRFQPKEQYLTGGTVGYKSDNFSITYRPDFVHENILTPGNANQTHNTAIDKEFIVNRFTNRLQSDFTVNPKLKFDLAASYQNYHRRTRTTTLDLATNKRTLTIGNSIQDETGFNLLFGRLTAVWKPLERLSLQPGVEVQSSRGKGDRVDGERTIAQTSFFLSAEYTPWQWLAIRAGVRSGIHSTYKAPKAVPSLNTKISIGRDMDLRLSYGHGFRAPTLQELYYSFHDANHNIDGNPNLKAEHSDSYMVSWLWRAVHHENARYTITVSGFYNNFRNRITMIPRADRPEYITYGNIGKYKTTGFSVENTLAWNRLKASLNFMMVGRYNLLIDDKSLTAEKMTPFRFSPELSASISYDWQKIAAVNLFYKYTGKRHEYRMVADKPVLQGLNDFHWCDITLSRPIGKYLTASIGARNLFDTTIVNSTVSGGNSSGHGTAGGPAQVSYGRSFFAGLVFNL